MWKYYFKIFTKENPEGIIVDTVATSLNAAESHILTTNHSITKIITMNKEKLEKEYKVKLMLN